jgi:hypothetical protein
MKAKVGDESGGSEEREVRGLERRRDIFVLIERKSAILFGFGGFLVYVACGISVWFFWTRKVSSSSVCSHPEKKTFKQVSKRFHMVLCFSLFNLAKLLKLSKLYFNYYFSNFINQAVFEDFFLLISITGKNLET